LIFGERQRDAPVTLHVRPQASSAACTTSSLPSRLAVMRAARDSTHRYHSVGRIRTARCRASSLGSGAVGYAPFTPEPRRTCSGYTASVFNSRLCIRTHSVSSLFVATPHPCREAVPVGVSCNVRSMAPVSFTGPAPGPSRSSWLRRGKLQKRVLWGLTTRSTGHAGTFFHLRSPSARRAGYLNR
jgi:hypothetical protein